MSRSRVAAVLTFALAGTAACSSRTLDAGDLDSHSEESVGSTASDVQYTGGCSITSCSNQSLTCAGGADAVNLTCSPHPTVASAPVFDGTCILAGACADDAGTPVCATKPLPVASDPDAGGVSGGVVGGSGFVSLELDAKAGAAPTETLSAFFTNAFTFDTIKTFGSCSYAKYVGAAAGQSGNIGPAPNPGVITVTSGSVSARAQPACDGTYQDAAASGAIASGSTLSIDWTRPSGNPFTFPDAYSELTAPHPITLTGASVFGTTAPELARTGDVQLTWTTDGTPLDLEQVVVELVQGEDSVTCSYPISAGAGTIPADALLELAPGATTYGIYAQHQYEDDGDSWEITLRARAAASTASGLAKGPLTLQ